MMNETRDAGEVAMWGEVFERHESLERITFFGSGNISESEEWLYIYVYIYIYIFGLFPTIFHLKDVVHHPNSETPTIDAKLMAAHQVPKI